MCTNFADKTSSASTSGKGCKKQEKDNSPPQHQHQSSFGILPSLAKTCIFINANHIYGVPTIFRLFWVICALQLCAHVLSFDLILLDKKVKLKGHFKVFCGYSLYARLPEHSPSQSFGPSVSSTQRFNGPVAHNRETQIPKFVTQNVDHDDQIGLTLLRHNYGTDRFDLFGFSLNLKQILA